MASKLLFLSATLFASLAVGSTSTFLGTEAANQSFLLNDSELLHPYRQWDSLSFLEQMKQSNDFVTSVLLVFTLAVFSSIAFWMAVIAVCCVCKCSLCYEEWNSDEFN